MSPRSKINKKYYEKNKELIAIKQKKYFKDNPDKRKATTKKYRQKAGRGRWLWEAYKITEDDYNKLLHNQKGNCAICKTHQSDLTKPLYVDHCHTTNRIRGLLCHNCNVGLGHFKDNKVLLQIAMNYLEEDSDFANPNAVAPAPEGTGAF